MAMQSDLQGLEMTIQSDFEEKKYEQSPSIVSPIASPISGISNGWFTIQNVQSGLVFDIEGVSKNKGARIQLSEDNRSPSQIFFIEKLNDRYSVIKNKASGLYLQINTDFFSFKEGAKLQQYPQNNDKDSQQFTFINVKENIYNIETKSANKYIDAAGKKVGARIQQYTPNNKRSQEFRIIPVKTGNQMPDGYYTIQNIKSELVWEMPQASNKKGKPIIQSKMNSTDTQTFYIQKVNDKYYSIKNEGSKQYLAIFNPNDRTKLQQYPKQIDQDSQQFTFIELDPDVFYIQSKLSDKYIDVPSGSNKPGVKIQQLTPKVNGTISQKFRIIPANDDRTRATRGFIERAKEKIVDFAITNMKDFQYQLELLQPILKYAGFELTKVTFQLPKIELKCKVKVKYQDKKWDESAVETDKLSKIGHLILSGMRNIDKARRASPLLLEEFTFGFEKGIPAIEFSFSPQFGKLKKKMKKKMNDKIAQIEEERASRKPSYNDILPSGWTERVDNNGKVFYQNDVTKKTQWTKPTI